MTKAPCDPPFLRLTNAPQKHTIYDFPNHCVSPELLSLCKALFGFFKSIIFASLTDVLTSYA